MTSWVPNYEKLTEVLDFIRDRSSEENFSELIYVITELSEGKPIVGDRALDAMGQLDLAGSGFPSSEHYSAWMDLALAMGRAQDPSWESDGELRGKIMDYLKHGASYLSRE